MSREEMSQLGWDSCDIILITGDAYVDRPSLGMTIRGRILEAQGFRVGIIAQPDWNNKDGSMRLGKPNLFFSATAGNMDSMINRYIIDHRLRHDDAYTPNDVVDKRPDCTTLVYIQRCKKAWKDVPVILSSIEAGLRRTAHYDYWSDTVCRSVLVDLKADMLMFGNGECPLMRVVYHLTMGKPINRTRDVRNTAIITKEVLPDRSGVDSTRLDTPGKISPIPHPYGEDLPCADDKPVAPEKQEVKAVVTRPPHSKPWEKAYVLLSSFEEVKGDKVLCTHASCILHHETSPGCAYALMQEHGDRYVQINPPATPLSTREMDNVLALPYKRVLYPVYGSARTPVYEMIRFSVNIMRGCFGGCSLCSIAGYEECIIQSHSEDSIIDEVETTRGTVPGFTGMTSDPDGPAANMCMLRCRSPRAEQTYRRLSCVYPDICPHVDTNHKLTINLYRRARNLKGIRKILIASGMRYNITVEDPRYIEGLATHHAGGYLKIAPGHIEEEPLSKMMKPGMGSCNHLKGLSDTHSKRAGKEQYLIPYFISAHLGTRDEDTMNPTLWLKKHRSHLGRVQNFYPSSLANLATMYYIRKNPLAEVGYKSRDVFAPEDDKQCYLHKALLRYHDPTNWPLVRQALEVMGREHLISSRRDCLVPAPTIEEMCETRRRNRNTRPALTKHTPIATQRQTLVTAKKASSTQSHPVNAGAKKQPRAVIGR